MLFMMPGQKLLSVHDAVQNGNVLELEAMVKRGGSLNELDAENKFTPLHWACHSGALECLHWLLWHGADLTVTTPQGWTPAHVAAIRGQDSCIQALATSGASFNARDERGNTPAHLAAAHGNSYTLASILRGGTDVDAKNLNGWSSVHMSSFHGRLGCLQLLVKWGARTDETDNSGNIPAHLAAMEGHLPCLKFLVSSGQSIMDTLGSRNDNGETPKTLASQFYKQNCVDYLGAVEWERDNPEEQENLAFPAHIAAANGDLSHLRILIEQGVVNINEKDDKGSTPAHKAAGNGHLASLQWLVEMGANIHIQNSAGETPIDVASRFAQLACVKLLKGDSSDSDEEAQDYNNAEVHQDMVTRLAADHGVEGDNIPQTAQQKEEARGRAFKRIEELERLMSIAKQNFRQLGGRLEEDREMRQKERESQRVIGELESQLEYERLRREKLESQLDECRKEIKRLNAHIEEISNLGASGDETKAKKKTRKKKKPLSGAEGVFVKRTINKSSSASPRTLDLF